MFLSVLMALAIVVGGCAGGDDDAAGDPAARKAEFIEKANAGCERERSGLNEEVSSFLRRFRSSMPPQVLYVELAQLVLLPTMEAEAENIRRLRIPPSEGERIDEILYLVQLGTDYIANIDKVASLDAVYRQFAQPARQFRAYGLAACAEGLKPPAALES